MIRATIARLCCGVVLAALAGFAHADLASADTVTGDHIDQPTITGNADGTQTFHVSYTCASTSSYANLLIKTEQRDGLNQTKVYGQGALGSTPTCNGSSHNANITVSAVFSSQWITGGTQNFALMFCISEGPNTCVVDTADDSTAQGSIVVLGGKGGFPPAVTPDEVVVTSVNHATGQVSGTYVCPTGSSGLAGYAGQLFQDQGLNSIRVVATWVVTTAPTCDGNTHSFTATAAPDLSGQNLQSGNGFTGSGFTAPNPPSRFGPGSQMAFYENGGPAGSANINLI